MTTTPPAAIGGDELAKALRDAYGQGCRHAVGVAPESATAYREKRDAWIRQYMARLAPAVGAGGDPVAAVAPDMLAALKGLVENPAFELGTPMVDGGASSRKRRAAIGAWDGFVDAARVAIAKAEAR